MTGLEKLPRKLVVAIGGNATHPENIKGTTEEQEVIAARAVRALLPLIEIERELVVTHGNGPVVGKILLRQFHSRHQIPPMRLDICVAHSQGGIGYVLMQAFQNELERAGIEREVACVLTQVEVDRDDPAFKSPSKPIGPFFSPAEAEELTALGWRMMEDAGRGWRLAVASPQPRRIVNLGMIQAMEKRGAIVIAAGGGGIPVVRRKNGLLGGIQAVVDKDLSSALLANQLGINCLMILTAVPRVAIHFGKPEQRWLDRVTVTELERYQREGHFARGSMAPKVEAAIRFLRGGGKRAVIAHLNEAVPALKGETGTQVVAG